MALRDGGTLSIVRLQTLLESAGLLLNEFQVGSWTTFVYALPKMTETHDLMMGRVL